MFDKGIRFPVIPGFMINFNYKHKNIKNSLFFLPQKHFPIKLFMEPSIMVSPTFYAANNVWKKAWAQTALLQEKLFWNLLFKIFKYLYF